MLAIPLGTAIYIDDLQLSFQENPGILNPEKSWKHKNVKRFKFSKSKVLVLYINYVQEVVHNFGKSHCIVKKWFHVRLDQKMYDGITQENQFPGLFWNFVLSALQLKRSVNSVSIYYI